MPITLRDLFDSVSYNVEDDSSDPLWWDTPLTRQDPDDGFAFFDDRFESLHPRFEKGHARGGKFRGQADLLADISLLVEPGLAHLPQAQATFYRNTLASVLSTFSASALARVRNRVDRFRFYPDLSSVTQQFRSITDSASPTVSYIWEVQPDAQRGILHLDGGSDSGERHRDVISHIYLHALGHVLDGVQKKDRISSSPAWRAAWKAEIDNITTKPLTAHATLAPEDGFAEYARAILSPDKSLRQAARKLFPACYQVWKDYHLL